MNKEEFNTLTIEDQVEYINTQLALVSLNRISTAIGISESTIRDRFKNKGYTRQGKSFIKLGTTEPTKENIKQSTPKKNTTTTSNTKAQEQKQRKVLENRIDGLEKELESIKAILTTITTSTTTTVNTNTTRAIKTYEGNGVSRSYRVNEEVQKKWKVFCKSHSEHRVSDLISNALEEYMNSFK